MGAIRKAEQARFAYLLNVLVSSLPPPTRPVDCMNYSSICNKQLGNYYCHNQINNSPCDVATTWQNLFTYPRQGRIYGLGVARLSSSVFFFFNSSLLVLCCLSSSSTFFLSLFTPAFFIPPSLVSLSRTFMKGELLWWRECGPACTPALRSLSASMRQSFFCYSFFLIQFGWRQVHSFSLIGFVYSVCVCVCWSIIWVLCSPCLFRK